MNDNTIIYCNNCGLKGHIQRGCRNPVLSCGNLIFRKDTEEPKVLMIQRKDSLCYIEFIRGKYDVFNIDYIQILIDKFTLDEKTMGDLVYKSDIDGTDTMDVAKGWIADNENIWSEWLK